MYDNGDEEELLAVGFYKRQKLYAQEGIYDPKGKAEQRAPPPPPKLPSTTKKDNTKKRKSVQKKTSTPTKKKTTKKTDQTALPTPKLHDADGDTIDTHGNYTPQRPYSYEVQYKDGSQPTYTPFVLKDHFLPKFRLPTGVIPSVAAMCDLSLPDSIIDGIVTRSNMYAMARTKLEENILVDGVLKRNPRWMLQYNYRDITRQDILFFFACYYYMGYCRLPARRDYWVERQPNSCLPSHWINGQFSRNKFEYVWRNISLDSAVASEEFDQSVEVGNDGEFEPEEEVEEVLVETVEEEDDDDNNDDDESKKDDEQNEYFEDKEPAPEKEENDEMSNDNDDDSVDDETINEEDDDFEAKQEKWYAKAKFMLDWVNKFSRTHCVHPGFAISIDEMMKLFKGRSNMTHRMKKKPIKEGFKFYAMVCAMSGYCFFFFPDGLKEKKKRGVADAVVFMV